MIFEVMMTVNGKIWGLLVFDAVHLQTNGSSKMSYMYTKLHGIRIY